MSKLWNVFHRYHVDGGFGDAVCVEDLVGTVEATDEEIKEFLQKWNKPEVYDRPYDGLYCHHIRVEEVIVKSLDGFKPYSTDPDDYLNSGIQEMKEQTS